MSEPIDFQPFCKNCPKGDTHCCTQKGNVVLVLKKEKEKLQELYDKLAIIDTTKNPYFRLFNNDAEKGKFTPLNNIKTSIKDISGEDTEVDLCPFFGVKDDKCLIHKEKPFDCRVWPIVKFENPEVHIDSNCSAINSKTTIPLDTVKNYIGIIDTELDETDKLQYYDLTTKAVYDLEPIPIEHWDTFQEIKESSNIEQNIQEVKTSLRRFRKRYSKHYYDPKTILRITKWVLAIFFGLIMSSFINQITYNVSVLDFPEKQYFINQLTNNKENIFLHIGLLLLMSLIFIIDIYRIIIPLPWVLKRYSKEKDEGLIEGLPSGVPRYQIIKLVSIGTISFILLEVMAIRFVIEPLHYFLMYGILLLLDSCWYIFNNKRIELISHLIKVVLPYVITIGLLILISKNNINILIICTTIATMLYCFLYFLVNYTNRLNKVKILGFLKKHNRLKEFNSLNQEMTDFADQKNISDPHKLINLFVEKDSETQNNKELDFAIKYFKKQIKLNKLKFKKQKEVLINENIALDYFDNLERRVAGESFVFFVVIDCIICLVTPLLIIINNNYLLKECETNWISDNYVKIIYIALLLHCIVAIGELIRNKWYTEYIKYLYIKPIDKTEEDD